MSQVGRPPFIGIPRPPCPNGHAGRIQLNGRRRAAEGRFEKTRYRCIPADRGERLHDFYAPLPARLDRHEGHDECESCERPFLRTQGVQVGWRYAFPVRDVAIALVRAGNGDSYREISLDLRNRLGRRTHGRRRGRQVKGAQLTIDYLDAFGRLIADALAPTTWPRIIALDALPIRVHDHTLCCKPRRDEEKRERAEAIAAGKPVPFRVRPKVVNHTAPIIEIGRILIAVGYDYPGGSPQPVLIRFAGGGDQVSWAEFLSSLDGTPEWVVSDRDGGIKGAVAAVWGKKTTHYFCEQHIAANAGEKVLLDGIDDLGHPIHQLIERAQYGPDEWMALFDAATVTYQMPNLAKWVIANAGLMKQQWAKRQAHYPRSAGACEAVVIEVGYTLSGRQPYLRNADRLNTLLALARARMVREASVNAYSRILRDAMTKVAGKANPDWAAVRDPKGESSMLVLLAESQDASRAAKLIRHAPYKANAYRQRRAAYEAERAALGLPRSPRGRPRILRAQGSVAGKHVSDYGWLVAEWHPTHNVGLTPEEVPAGSGWQIWWKCAAGPDHEWATQVRSRALRGSGCPFCAHRAIAKSERFSESHPDIAAQWHPTRNGTKTPADFTYGSHYEAWWQCSKFKTHVWRARIASRTSMLVGCSLCAGGRKRADAVVASREEETKSA